MPTRWHMMSEKQLSILIQGRNYARGNRQIIRIPRAFACISAGAPWLWRSVMQIDKVSQEPARLRMLTAPFHGTFFFHWKFIVSALLAICVGNSPVPGEFPAQRPVTRSFDVFFDPRLNKRLSKQSWGWWFETLSCPLWPHCNGNYCRNSAMFRGFIGFSIKPSDMDHKQFSYISGGDYYMASTG